MNFRLDFISFVLGIATTVFVWWMASLLRPRFEKLFEFIRSNRANKDQKSGSDLEEAYLRAIYKKTQGMHLASSLFALNEIVIPTKLLAPPAIQDPGDSHYHQDVVDQTLPYLPRYPELGAFFNARRLTLSEALSGGMPVAIIGQPGAGKSVALAHLTAQLAIDSQEVKELHGLIPFLIHVADLNLPLSNPQNQEDYLAPIIENLSPLLGVFEASRFPKFVNHIFTEGRALLLLDGVDELPQTSIQEVSAYLRVLMRHYKNTRAVIAGAPEYLDGILSLGFVPLAIMPWSSKQQSDFLETWTELWQKHVALEGWSHQDDSSVDTLLINRWVASENFGLTPLEYTLKIWGAYGGDVYSTRPIDVIEAHIRRLTPPSVPTEALSILALQVSTNETPFFDARRARDWTKSFEANETTQDLPLDGQPEEVDNSSSDTTESPSDDKNEPGKTSRQPLQHSKSGLISTLVNSGLLSSRGKNRLGFSHPIFLGYLTGKGLASYPANTNTLLNQSSWNNQSTALKYMACFGDATEAVKDLLSRNDHILLRPKLLTAQLLRTPRDSRITGWRDSVMSGLVQILQNADHPIGLRAEAMVGIALSGDSNAGLLFRQLMLTNSSENHLLSALGAGLVRDPKSVDSLVSLTSNSVDAVRRAACLALVEIGTPKALEAVAVYLIRGDEQLRVYAAEALANHPSEGYDALREGIGSQDILVRRAVVYGLSRVTEPWSTELLEKTQINDDQWAVRNVAVESLQARQSANPCIPRKLSSPHDTPWLIELAGKYGMGIGPGQPATDILLLALKDPNKELFLPALAYLRNTPNEGVLAALYPFLFGVDPDAKEGVYQTLSYMALGGITLPDPKQYGLG